MQVAQLCPTLCNHLGYTVHGVLQARILEWVSVPFSRGSSQPRDQTKVSHIAGGFFTILATREALFMSQFSQFSSVAQLCLALCDRMDCSMPGLPVHHQLLEFTQTRVHWVGDAIYPSHPLSSSSPAPPRHRLQSFLASGSVLMSQFFASGGQSIGVSASTPVLPMNIQDWFPLGWTSWMEFLCLVRLICTLPEDWLIFCLCKGFGSADPLYLFFLFLHDKFLVYVSFLLLLHTGLLFFIFWFFDLDDKVITFWFFSNIYI